MGRRSGEKCCASSHSMTWGRISASANSRTVRRRISCSSDGRKSIEGADYHVDDAQSSCLLPPVYLLPCLLLLSAAPGSSATSPRSSASHSTPVKAALAKGSRHRHGADHRRRSRPSTRTRRRDLDADRRRRRCRRSCSTGSCRRRSRSRGCSSTATPGGGVYHESCRSEPNDDETNFGTNVGGGAKITLAGPLRLRLDYRVFTLRGTPRHTSTVQRLSIAGSQYLKVLTIYFRELDRPPVGSHRQDLRSGSASTAGSRSRPCTSPTDPALRSETLPSGSS